MRQNRHRPHFFVYQLGYSVLLVYEVPENVFTSVRPLRREIVEADHGANSNRERVLRELAERTASRAFAIAFDLLGERSEADDAVQEALARAWSSLDQLRDPAAVDGWFFRTLTRVCLRELRRRNMRRRFFIGESTRQRREALIDSVPGADLLLSRRSEIATMLDAIERLPVKQRATLVLRYGHDLTIPEVADMLGVSSGTVKTHLVRGLGKLRTLMEKKR
jgi:RNA polymerase sigma-70 factor (ECF subfamily)